MNGREIRARLSTSGGEQILRQTPGGSGRWGNVIFDVVGDNPPYDWWFVCHSTALPGVESTICDPAHVVYCSMEPRDWVSQDFLDQFALILSADPSHVKQGAMPINVTTWWVGSRLSEAGASHASPMEVLSYDDLKSNLGVAKSRRISVISSGKRVLAGHQRRFEFLRWLHQSRFGRHVDFFGTGFTPVPDKWHAIEPYDFHIAIENSQLPHYWSEKISDAYLGYAYPLYFGCPDIGDYFPAESFRELDITNYSRATEVIERALDAPPTSRELSSLSRAREEVLDRFNIFAVLAQIASTPANSLAEVALLSPNQLARSRPLRMRSRISREVQRLGVKGSAAWQAVRNHA